ncbi:uncharacterized protein [Amphiura filiformis]|uniref:uncharacterized protein n=1 Tax=Amphiura filiformis TaxID=82378 RepID=UPI003B215884
MDYAKCVKVRPYVCKYCGKMSGDFTRYHSHMRRHRVKIQTYWYSSSLHQSFGTDTTCVNTAQGCLSPSCPPNGRSCNNKRKRGVQHKSCPKCNSINPNAQQKCISCGQTFSKRVKNLDEFKTKVPLCKIKKNIEKRMYQANASYGTHCLSLCFDHNPSRNHSKVMCTPGLGQRFREQYPQVEQLWQHFMYQETGGVQKILQQQETRKRKLLCALDDGTLDGVKKQTRLHVAAVRMGSEGAPSSLNNVQKQTRTNVPAVRMGSEGALSSLNGVQKQTRTSVAAVRMGSEGAPSSFNGVQKQTRTSVTAVRMGSEGAPDSLNGVQKQTRKNVAAVRMGSEGAPSSLNGVQKQTRTNVAAVRIGSEGAPNSLNGVQKQTRTNVAAIRMGSEWIPSPTPNSLNGVQKQTKTNVMAAVRISSEGGPSSLNGVQKQTRTNVTAVRLGSESARGTLIGVQKQIGQLLFSEGAQNISDQVTNSIASLRSYIEKRFDALDAKFDD